MPDLSFNEVIASGYKICESCKKILEEQEGLVTVCSMSGELQVNPIMWRHSELDMYHGRIEVGDRHIFLCGTDEFDEKTLKRIRPLKREEINSWNLFINGAMYTVVEGDDSNYEILSEEGTIVKDEEIEARIFNYMMHIRT